MKTIFLSRAILSGWLAALRSGEYKQGRGRLKTPYGYCCLGVLQCVVSGKVETGPDGGPRGIPSMTWLNNNHIRFLDADSAIDHGPWLDSLQRLATEANDHGVGFEAIADAIEMAAEVTD